MNVCVFSLETSMFATRKLANPPAAGMVEMVVRLKKKWCYCAARNAYFYAERDARVLHAIGAVTPKWWTTPDVTRSALFCCPDCLLEIPHCQSTHISVILKPWLEQEVQFVDSQLGCHASANTSSRRLFLIPPSQSPSPSPSPSSPPLNTLNLVVNSGAPSTSSSSVPLGNTTAACRLCVCGQRNTATHWRS